MKRWLLALFTLSPVHAEVLPNGLFCDGAVLQRGRPIPVWGTAREGEQVTVSLDGQSVTTRARSGRWEVSLPTRKAGGPYELIINKRIVKDVLIGDVYLCSGQSNMEWPMRESLDPQAAIDASTDPNLRLFHVQHAICVQPQANAKAAGWEIADPASVAPFSAVAYYFARQIRHTQKVPIGLIESAYGGTVAESWTSQEALASHPELQGLLKATTAPLTDPNHATRLYNGMIAPLLPYGLRGVLWYQGESNADRAAEYRTLLPTMIADWRDRFQAPDLPFMFVQLAPYQKPSAQPGEHNWADLRESQRQISLHVSRTAMVVITDVGDADIHPKNKRTVGERLALAARHLVYAETLEWSGPTLLSARAVGGLAQLDFRHTGKGLSSGGAEVSGFTLAGADGKWCPAVARIVADSRVMVESPAVPQPVRVRYGWDIFPIGNLVNSAQLPASPFQADLK